MTFTEILNYDREELGEFHVKTLITEFFHEIIFKYQQGELKKYGDTVLGLFIEDRLGLTEERIKTYANNMIDIPFTIDIQDSVVTYGQTLYITIENEVLHEILKDKGLRI